MKNKINKPNNHGQAIVETAFLIILISAICFAALQICIFVVNDIICNEASFASARVAIISTKVSSSQIQKDAENTALKILTWFFSTNNMMYKETTLWDKKPLGWQIPVGNNENILSYTTNIKYDTKIMFSSLLNPFHNFTFFSGGNPLLERSARARLIRSPNRDFYNKAYPEAESFNE
ncbi:MAG: pilus assembly protein [Endomicrobiales bacterium]|nr:pilus assembly protein [Endomicrobiales bacterium]